MLVSDDDFFGDSTRRKVDSFDENDIVSLTLDPKSLCLSYNIIKNKDDHGAKMDTQYVAKNLKKTRYKWVVGIFAHPDCIEIIDVNP